MIKITNELINEIIKMDNPTSQDITVLREYLVISNMDTKLAFKVIKYLNLKNM